MTYFTNMLIDIPNYWRVISIVQIQNSSEFFCGFEINLPIVNSEITNGKLEIAGWALGKISPIKNICVSLKNNQDKILSSFPLSILREDIANIFVQIENAERSGFSFHIELNPDILPVVATFIISAELENNQYYPLNEIKVEYDQKIVEEFFLHKQKIAEYNQKIVAKFFLQKARQAKKVTGKVISIFNHDYKKLFYGFNLDLLNEQDDILDNVLEIQGWLLSKVFKIAKIIVYTEDSLEERAVLGETIPSLIREDIGLAFPNVENAKKSGFFLNIETEKLAPIAFLEVKVLLDDNSEHLLSTVQIENYQKTYFKIAHVQETLASELIYYHIDIPKFFEKPLNYEFYDLEMSGWVLGKEYPVVSIKILDENQHILQTIPIQYPRTDVLELFQEIKHSSLSGWSVIVNLLTLPMQATISLVAYLENGATALLTHFNIQRFPLRTLYQPKLQPLVINSLGRSGTTWLMHLLAQHLKVGTYKNYPYELPVIEHFLHNVLVHNAFEFQPDQIPYPELDVNDLFKLNRHRMYHVKDEPLKYYFRKQQIEELAYFCQEQIDKYIEQILRFQERIGEGLENPVYFAEKLINPSRDTEYLSRLIWELYPQGREIILVRDFRDMFCSILSFMKKRDLKICFGLDFQHAHTEEEYVEITKQRIDFIWNCWETRKHKAHLVRYEDLIEKPLPILKGIFEYLNVDHDEATLQMILQKASKRNAEMTDHITSSTVDASLGRWKKDLSPELQRLCNEAFKPALEAFGYSVETY